MRGTLGTFYLITLHLLLQLVCLFISQFAYFLSSCTVLHPYFLPRTTVKLHLQLICYAQKCNVDSLSESASFWKERALTAAFFTWHTSNPVPSEWQVWYMCQKHSHQNHVTWVVILTSLDTSCSPVLFHPDVSMKLLFFFFFFFLRVETGISVSSETESLSFLYYCMCGCGGRGLLSCMCALLELSSRSWKPFMHSLCVFTDI